jgi:hypothetical protein
MKRQGSGKLCAYCPKPATTTDHVVSRALYPPSKASSRNQRITVPACKDCNGGWSGDEPHFRNMLLLSGDPNAAVRELWEGKTRRSFAHRDGRKRARDLTDLMVPVETAKGPRHLIYPGRDERVLRIVRKIVRGLCHHHGVLSPVADEQVLADVQKFAIPEDFLAEMTAAHAEADVLEYHFGLVDEPDIHSGWLLIFYERTPFFCLVFRSPAARRQFDVAAPERPDLASVQSSSP